MLLGGFDAFRQNRNVEAMGEINNRTDNRDGMLITFQIADEGTINLYFIERKSMEV